MLIFNHGSINTSQLRLWECFPASVQFSRSVVSDSATSWTAARQVFLSTTSSRSLLKLSSSSQWCHPTISSSVIPFSSHLQSFSASGSFQMSQFFKSGGQNIGASTSASVLPMNNQDWFPLGLTGLISLKSKRLSTVFTNTIVQNHQFFGTQLYSPALTSINDYWKSNTFHWMDLCRQSNVSDF